jgi:hypothetical protein
MRISIYPPPPQPPTVDGVQLIGRPEGIFTEYSASIPARKVELDIHQTQTAAMARPLRMGSKRKPVPPSNADFDAAGVWQIKIPRDALEGVADVRLRIAYAGDVARAYLGDRLIDDDFYYGEPWEIGLKRFAPDIFDAGLTLKILPTPAHSPIYIQDDRRARLRADGNESGFDGAALVSVEPDIVYEVKMHCGQ